MLLKMVAGLVTRSLHTSPRFHIKALAFIATFSYCTGNPIRS
ncbi:unnamed protein product [Protopolystoma xenopodis]|uniref:Uncharacterized protein n=1 Tax=Protopolystoma xenopodis TaxID=117903 RepID=A0A3S5FDT2_9PLAT|nr:unnamed protein product [Protopolystoma xenopodis]